MVFLTLSLLASGLIAQADPVSMMICEPRSPSDFPSEILSEPIEVFGEGSHRYLSLKFKQSSELVTLEPVSRREFIGILDKYTVFFQLEGDNFVKIILSLVDLAKMETIGPVKLNCYAN